MDLSDVRRLYAYTDWANDRFLDVIGRLPEEQFTQTIVSSYSSIRDTLSHIASAEWIWLRRWMGESPLEVPSWATAPSFAVLQTKIHAVAGERRAYLADLAPAAIESILHYRSIKGDPFALPLREVLIHCANHSTYHRGQLVTMLRQAGAQPPTTDYSLFAREQ